MLDKMPAPTFRTAVGGYNKDDINNYIRETNASFLASSKEYEDRIHDLSTSVAERDRTIAELKKKLSAADGEELSRLRLKNGELSDALASVGEENRRSGERIKELERELAELRDAEAEEAEEEPVPEEKQKAEAYDKVSAQIGRILLDARENAESVIAAAQSEADEIRAQARDELETARSEADGLRRDAEEDCRRTKEKLRNVGTAFGCSVDDMAKRIEREVGLVIGNVCGMLRSAADGADEEISELSHKLGVECESMLDSALRSAKRDVASATGIPADELHAVRRGELCEDRIREDRPREDRPHENRPRDERSREQGRTDGQRTVPSREDRARAEARREEQRRAAQRHDQGFRSVFSQREKK